MIDVRKALAAIAKHRGDAIMVTTQMAGREWGNYTTNPKLDLFMVGCMGKASSTALGIALAKPERRVVVIDGDGSILMNLGSLVTIANQKPNLVHFVFENGIYETTGGQPVPGEGTFDLARMASGAGYAHMYDLEDEEGLEPQIAEAMATSGPTFVRLRVTEVGGRGPALPRPREGVRILMAALAEGQ
jgi:sulfopyruvate decarboxylase subunit beta